MTNNVSYPIMYLGAVQVKKGIEYTTTQMQGNFPSADVFIMKSKSKTDEMIHVTIDNTVAMPVSFNESTVFDSLGSINQTFMFTQDCIIGLAKKI